jgi:hypothetical protein
MFFIDMVVMTATSGASIVEIRFHDSPSSLLSSYAMSEKKKKNLAWKEKAMKKNRRKSS